MNSNDRKRIGDAERTLYATDFPARSLPQIIDRLRDADGVRYDCAILGWDACRLLLAHIERLGRGPARPSIDGPLSRAGDFFGRLTLEEVRGMAKEMEARLLSTGDPLCGDDWGDMQVCRCLLRILEWLNP